MTDDNKRVSTFTLTVLTDALDDEYGATPGNVLRGSTATRTVALATGRRRARWYSTPTAPSPTRRMPASRDPTASPTPRPAPAADPNLRGGARIAVGDVNGDGVHDLVVTAGFLGGPRITVWDGLAVLAGRTAEVDTPLLNFFAFEDSLRNGAYVTVGDVTGDGRADIASRWPAPAKRPARSC